MNTEKRQVVKMRMKIIAKMRKRMKLKINAGLQIIGVDRGFYPLKSGYKMGRIPLPFP